VDGCRGQGSTVATGSFLGGFGSTGFVTLGFLLRVAGTGSARAFVRAFHSSVPLGGAYAMGFVMESLILKAFIIYK
jgi:hypothetical protein